MVVTVDPAADKTEPEPTNSDVAPRARLQRHTQRERVHAQLYVPLLVYRFCGDGSSDSSVRWLQQAALFLSANGEVAGETDLRSTGRARTDQAHTDKNRRTTEESGDDCCSSVGWFHSDCRLLQLKRPSFRGRATERGASPARKGRASNWSFVRVCWLWTTLECCECSICCGC